MAITTTKGKAAIVSLSVRDLFRIFSRAAFLVGAALIIILVADLGISWIGNRVGLYLDPAIWGTYAAWASAILPTLGIILTAGLWFAANQETHLLRAEAAAMKVLFERAPGAVPSLSNGSSDPLIIVRTDPDIVRMRGMVLKPGSPRVNMERDTTSVRFKIRQHEFCLDLQGQLSRAGE